MLLRVRHLGLLTLSLAPLFVVHHIRAEQVVEFPLQGDIRGSEELLQREPLHLLIGEVHGTAEIPPLVASLVRSFPIESRTLICLEIAADEQARLDAFLASDGGEAATNALLSGPHWIMPDGRASGGYLKMLNLIRQLARQGRPVSVAAIDVDPLAGLKGRTKPLSQEEILQLSRERDKQMADNVLQAINNHSDSNLVVLVGNVHASVQQGTPWDAKYKPLGWHLKQELPDLISLNFQTAGGKAWVMTDSTIGEPKYFAGTDRGVKPFVELFKTTTAGYDGVLYVGKMTASAPAKKQTSELADLLQQARKLIPAESDKEPVEDSQQ